ncbi:hypothetical protein D3C85_1375300 [compost metagenome]
MEFSTNFKPKCDMFCDVKVDKTKKTLTSSCRGSARTHTDIWKYDRNKKLILPKQNHIKIIDKKQKKLPTFTKPTSIFLCAKLSFPF